MVADVLLKRGVGFPKFFVPMKKVFGQRDKMLDPIRCFSDAGVGNTVFGLDVLGQDAERGDQDVVGSSWGVAHWFAPFIALSAL